MPDLPARDPALEPGTLPYEYVMTDALLDRLRLRHGTGSWDTSAYALADYDPTIRYRTTFLYGDQSQPPNIEGTVASHILTAHNPIESGTQAEGLELMPESIGRIVVEERHFDDVHHADRGDRWRVLRTWTRTADGWEHS